MQCQQMVNAVSIDAVCCGRDQQVEEKRERERRAAEEERVADAEMEAACIRALQAAEVQSPSAPES